MTYLLRRIRAQNRIEGREPPGLGRERLRRGRWGPIRPDLHGADSRQDEMALVPPDPAGTSSE